eukprot:Plantae.Rhodophyta-Hildenbrandia_rubra.ctg32210.p1 GENE.Plantae.Rhodophyta-Hildenbrandia_rubra.ctg32210~~Plantae.Rhodophyta-Hildenbrandia_rubra.ctg32210.p1  ORF type:complete len:363 (+),score=52.03 Plantae.Rhodophyta-Hildenbrandia_rubra.ctg32210:128-1216(+)
MSYETPTFLSPCSHQPFTQSLSLYRTTHPYRPPKFQQRSRRRPRFNTKCTAEPISSPPAASKEVDAPPSTFYQAIKDAQNATIRAFENGDRVVEVEFPPLPTSQLESASVGSYDVSDANLRLAIEFGKKWIKDGKKVVIVLPDWIEKTRAMELNGDKEEPVKGLRLGCLKDEKKGGWLERIWTKLDTDVAVQEDDHMFVVIGASAQELPDVEALAEVAGERPVVLFNLKLDTARGDLGLPAFPRKTLHYRFLSRVRPVYYLRTRTYSRSLPRPPYVVNYSGALFRVFPGDYQVLLDTSQGKYRRVKTLKERPSLGVVRDYLTDGLDLDGVKGKQRTFLFKGYKSTTWWEDDRTKQESNNWRE